MIKSLVPACNSVCISTEGTFTLQSSRHADLLRYRVSRCLDTCRKIWGLLSPSTLLSHFYDRHVLEYDIALLTAQRTLCLHQLKPLPLQIGDFCYRRCGVDFWLSLTVYTKLKRGPQLQTILIALPEYLRFWLDPRHQNATKIYGVPLDMNLARWTPGKNSFIQKAHRHAWKAILITLKPVCI